MKKLKTLKVAGISMIASTSFFAQSSYNLNSSPINGVNNAAFGLFSLVSVPPGGGTDNSAFGISSLGFNTTGSRNTGCGLASLASNTSASDNTGIGYRSLQLSTGAYNSALGASSLYNNTTGYANCAVGAGVMYFNTTGYANTAVGKSALQNNTSGYYNTAVGYESMLGTTNGIHNTAVGWRSLVNNTNGSTNCAFGGYALELNNGHANTAIGHAALGSSGYGSANTAVGKSAHMMNLDGVENVAVGSGALINSTTGDSNVVVGASAMTMNSGGSRNTILGAYANASSSNFVNASAIGYGAIVNASNRMWLGNTSLLNGVWTIAFYNPSDKRFKSNIKSEDVKGLEFIKLLRPVVYNFEAKKLTEHLTQHMPDSLRKIYLSQNFKDLTEIRRTGFIAQEVEEAAKRSGYNFSGVHSPESDVDTYGIAYAEFVVPLVKAVQEQQAQIEQQQKEIVDLKEALKTKLTTTTGIGQLSSPENGFSMDQNIPNPFSRETLINYTLTKETKSAVLNVYDLSGKQLTSFPLASGSSSLSITSEKLAAGIYIYSIVADGKIMDSKRMIVAEK